jgi:transcriptional regulator with PAS, ATPase and Fis domain
MTDFPELRKDRFQIKPLTLSDPSEELIIGSSPSLNEVFRLIGKVSDSDSTILIRGESGTGKELIAKMVHRQSHRALKSFIAVNCGALPEGLLESELFGHVKGAFTGALYSRKGRFELADQGTIFLDEVGDMSPRLQIKLLRVLQEQVFEPVGMSQSVKVNVRIISATHQDLEKAVEEKIFREDLYYRLNVIPIVMPPLRDRVLDIPLLSEHFLKKFNRQKRKKVAGFSVETMNILCKYLWPGNVRELENLIERLVILKGEGTILDCDLPTRYLTPRSANHSLILPCDGIDLNRAIDEMEGDLIDQALMRTGGNRNKAASLLRLKRTTLVEKLKRR